MEGRGSLRGAKPLSFNILSSLPIKGRGIKGDRVTKKKYKEGKVNKL